VGTAGLVVVGLLSGVIGAGLTGLLQLRRDRLDRLRERQLAAADDFATVAAEVFISLAVRMETLPSGEAALAQLSDDEKREWLEQIRRASKETRKDVHVATARLPRLELLFGVDSPPAAAATQLIGHLHKMSLELAKERGDLPTFTREYTSAAEASGRFHKAANAVVAQSQWARWRNQE
jgi:hypothetical protein